MVIWFTAGNPVKEEGNLLVIGYHSCCNLLAVSQTLSERYMAEVYGASFSWEGKEASPSQVLKSSMLQHCILCSASPVASKRQ